MCFVDNQGTLETFRLEQLMDKGLQEVTLERWHRKLLTL